jgi:hypothetical protein
VQPFATRVLLTLSSSHLLFRVQGLLSLARFLLQTSPNLWLRPFLPILFKPDSLRQQLQTHVPIDEEGVQLRFPEEQYGTVSVDTLALTQYFLDYGRRSCAFR